MNTQYMKPQDLVEGKRSKDPSLATQTDIADMAGVHKNTVTKWQQRGHLPQPTMRIPQWNMPLYSRKEVLNWLLETGRIIPQP